MAEKPRTRAKARERVIELDRRAADRAARDPAHADEPARGGRGVPRRSSLARIPGGVDPACVSTGLIGASTGPHLGPGLMGAAFLRRR